MLWKLMLGICVLLVVGGILLFTRNSSVSPAPVQADQGEERNGGNGPRSRGSLPSSDGTRTGTVASTGETTETSKTVAQAGQEGAAVSGDLTSGSEDQTSEEAETAARERYEQAQKNAYRFRKTDPSKVVAAPVMPALAEAAQKYKVPAEILTALMAVESGGAHRDADHSMEGGFGVMNLKENNLVDTLGEAAALVGRSKEEVLYDQKLNIEAAAALLARYYEDSLAAGLTEPEAWYMALSQYSGRPNPELAAALADEVAGMIMRGFETDLHDGGGKVVLPADPTPPFYPKNWKLAGVTPPPNAGRELENSADAMEAGAESDGIRGPLSAGANRPGRNGASAGESAEGQEVHGTPTANAQGTSGAGSVQP